MLAQTMLLCALALQDAVPAPRPLHQTIVLELREDDPVLAGHGASKKIEFSPDDYGAIYVWATSPVEGLDLFLRAEGGEGKPREDDDSGGMSTPFLGLPAGPGLAYSITVAVARPGGGGKVQLHFGISRETQATLEASAWANSEVAKMPERIAAAGTPEQHVAVRESVKAVVDKLLATPGAAESAKIHHALFAIGDAAYQLSLNDTGERALAATCSYYETVLPATHSSLAQARESLALFLKGHGDLQGALQLEEPALELLARMLPETSMLAWIPALHAGMTQLRRLYLN